MRSLIPLAAILAVALSTPPVAAQEARPRTWANPVDVDYKYNFEQTRRGVSYRTGADPVIVLHRDRYVLFQTLADGYWTSADLLDWSYVQPNKWPFESNVAPAAVSDGERLYLMQSAFEPRPLLVSEHPGTGQWDWHTRILPPVPGAVSRNEEGSLGEGGVPGDKLPPGPWDPGLFIDDDGKWYLYWGSSNVYPLYGSEIDPTPPVRFIGQPTRLHVLHPDQHGWERFGQDHSGGLPNGTAIKPFMEGAWMTKHGGRYYLQYGAPGTEYNAYANGTYVAESPLGPFEYAPYNPVSYKPGGFVEGAGHGSTFQDRHGNWWNTGTPWIGHNWTFERRIAMFPGGFTADGQMHFSSRFGDYPQRMPTERVSDPDSLFTGWFPLSYKAAAEASSTRGEYSADRATDENPRTFWVADSAAPGQTLTLDLGAMKTVHAVQVNYADHESGVYAERPDIRTRFRILTSRDGADWAVFADLSGSNRDRPNAYVEGERPVAARFVRYKHGEVAAANLAISDLRVFGTADGLAPERPALRVERGEDPRNATVHVTPVSNALGYNVRWGTAPDRLFLTYQVYFDDLAEMDDRLEVRALNAGVDYWFAVEAFSPSGVSPLSRVVAVPAGRPAWSASCQPAAAGPMSPSRTGGGTMRLLLATTAALALFTAGAAQAQTGSTDVELRQSIARDYDANLGALFDDFHRNPELSGMEVRTAGIMAAQLTALGYDVTTGVGGTGVVAVLRNGDGPTVMVRADMDGLPLHEQSGLANASTVRQTDSDGVEKPVMHACGHDVHITALIGTARQMMARRQDWSGTLVLIAQPAEERIFGARAMVEDGLYTRFPKPEVALAFHVSADLATGLIDLPLGITSSSSDSVDIAVHGVGTHGAYPHMGVDPIVVASAIVMNLQTLPSRTINPLEGAVVTVGAIHGGIKHNIISDRVDMQLTVRADNPETRTALLDGIDRVARGTALALGVPEDRLPTVVRSPTETTPPTINDAATAARVRAALGAAMGADRLVDVARTGMGAEDFAYFVTPESGVKGVYFSVGGTPAEQVETAPGHHSPLFRIDPRPSVVTGVEAMVVAAQVLMPKG